jgi:CMP-N-acetylneuraminic acid synthetase
MSSVARRLAVVPARGGSKRLPGKNLRPLRGKPLINHTVDVARACFDCVIVTSDSSEILEVVDGGPNVHREHRPPHLATDQSKVIDTVIYYFEEHKENSYDQIWLCLPTCPLRTEADVRDGFEHLTKDIDGVVSVTPYEFPPTMALRIDSGLLTSVSPVHQLADGNSRSQDHPQAYRPNGAFYGMWWSSFGRLRNFYRGNVKPCIMPRQRSVDVDHADDFLLAQAMLDLHGGTSGQ